jgi:mono/diheme cytochrome c family protein
LEDIFPALRRYDRHRMRNGKRGFLPFAMLTALFAGLSALSLGIAVHADESHSASDASASAHIGAPDKNVDGVANAASTTSGQDQTLAMLKHGAQLAAVGDCMVCHTAKGGKPFAGGLPLRTPFGTLYTTNITPDLVTGIGGWSEADFVLAMRKGVSRDGHLLYPAFPYVHFTHVTENDLHALYGYLMSRDPVHASPPPNKLVFPLNFRPIIAGWNLLFLHGVGETEPQATSSVTSAGASPAAASGQNAEWHRGQYLVDGLGHCAACHTPMNFLGAEKSGQAFSGGTVDGWSAPALTTLLDRPIPWSQEQLVTYLRTGLASEHGAAAGPMLAVTHRLAEASADDVKAIAVYVMSLQHAPGAESAPPAPTAPTAPTAPPASAASSTASSTPAPMTQQPGSTATDAVAPAGIGAGATIFAASCAGCHGAGAPMSTQVDRPGLSLSTAVNAADPRNAVQQILQGIALDQPGTGRYMPAFADILTDAQIVDVLNYTRATYGANRGPWPSLDANAVQTFRKEGIPQ